MFPNPFRRPSRRSRTLILTALGLGLVLAFGLWDATTKMLMALRQLMHEHHLLAATLPRISILNADNARVDSLSQNADKSELTTFGRAAIRVERDQGFVVLLMDPVRGPIPDFPGSLGSYSRTRTARSHGDAGTLLSRDTATLLGLPVALQWRGWPRSTKTGTQ